jgi:hypothetical protein
MVSNSGGTVLDPKTKQVLQIPCQAMDDFSTFLLASVMSAQIEMRPSHLLPF